MIQCIWGFGYDLCCEEPTRYYRFISVKRIDLISRCDRHSLVNYASVFDDSPYDDSKVLPSIRKCMLTKEEYICAMVLES